jgi:hypothetical protein
MNSSAGGDFIVFLNRGNIASPTHELASVKAAVQITANLERGAFFKELARAVYLIVGFVVMLMPA